MKKILTVLMTTTLVFTMATGMCFAAVGVYGDENVIKVMADIEGYGAGTQAVLDFTISDQIDVYSDVLDSELEFENLTITNNAPVGQLKIECLEVTPKLGWVLAEDSAEYFANQRCGTKEFSIVCEGHDFYTANKQEYGNTKLVPSNGGTLEFAFTGHMGPFRTSYSDAELAEVILTVSLY